MNKNEKQLKAPSSGAVSRVLMGKCITKDCKVMGYTYDTKENIAKPIVASTIDELGQFYGSKYFQSLATEGLDEVLKDRIEKKHTIFGTPCQIYGFSQTSKYKRKPDSYLLVDIFCHGCPSMKLWRSYLKYMSKHTGCFEYDKVVFRSKAHAWHEYYFDFTSRSKQYSSKKLKDPFYDISFGMDIMNEACYDCNSRSSMAYGGIRLDDYWGEEYDTNTKGMSAVVIKTPKDVEVFEAVKGRLSVEEVTPDYILAAQPYGKTHFYSRQKRRFLLQDMLGGSDLKKVYTTYMKMFPLKSRIKKQLRTIVKCCPKSVYFLIKELTHSI